ncbi:hypothetical protein [Streptomyces sp. A0592]|uniref:hypothetical protein n=1 Tax=Streptomyces sp. A0592 TaxID=2563099 RepID=UPI001446A1D3|nr:hypothetical protein [Streptomyces sp. A0592]
MIDKPSAPAPPEPDRTPRENTILSEPATVEACARDYETAAHIRALLAKQR